MELRINHVRINRSRPVYLIIFSERGNHNTACLTGEFNWAKYVILLLPQKQLFEVIPTYKGVVDSVAFMTNVVSGNDASLLEVCIKQLFKFGCNHIRTTKSPDFTVENLLT